MFKNFIENEIDSKSSAELRAKFFKNIEVKQEKMSSSQQQHQPPPPLKRIKTLTNREREQKLRKTGVQPNDKQNFVEKPKIAKEKGQNLKKSKVQMEASMTHSQGSTCRQEKELPSKSTTVAHKVTNEVDSRMTQDLKRKETTNEDDIEECGSLQERPTKKGKTRQFASMPIDTFFQLNNEPDGEEQLDENEGDIIEEQDKDYINPTEAENIDNTLKGKLFAVSSYGLILLFSAALSLLMAASKENNEPPTQAEMFVETRQSTKGKSLDEDTLDVIAHLQAENKKSKESAIRAFQSIFSKEKAGRVRCHGRVTTPTLLKKNEEIATLKQQHVVEKASLEGKVDVMQKEVDELKSLVKMMLKQKSSGVDLEMLAAQLGSTLGNPNNDAHEEENYVEGEIELG
ncbi:hypothetical protein Ahy_A03g013033 [Arachis hypogaea]|uniref:Uncharacterized protein n=1 Tax=Arachis hypogaea TaxID=3818 RepID=A0A445DUP1_ARAHY|nr:hypothetical protein Ahy_A03g013033 [Arachis hypogaea]